MKRMYRVFFFLVLAYILTPIVKAEDIEEYTLVVNANNTVSVYDENMNPKSGSFEGVIYDWDETTSTLTLKENIHYECIQLNIDEGIITSNDSNTYINFIIGKVVNIKNLSFTTYDSNSTNSYEIINQVDSKSHIHSEELVIESSNIKMKTPGVTENNIIHTELITTPVGNGNFLIKDSIIDTDGSIGAQGDLTIKNSNVKTYGAASMTQSSIITIDESTIYLLSNTIRQMSDLGIVGTFIVCPNKIVVKDNSKIYSNGIIMSYNTMEVINSEIKGSNEYDIDYIPALVVYEKLTATNSSFDLTGPALIKQMELNNSILSSQSGASEKIAQDTTIPVDYSTSSALVAKTVELNNSNLIAISHTDVPAIMIIDPLISNNENQIFVNGENAIESFEIVNYSDYGFLPTNGFNNITLATIGVTNNEGYTALLNGEASYDVRTSEKVTIKLKIENGTWEDGSTEDIEVVLIKGQIPNKDTIKSISLIEGGILTIKQTGENEYTFIYSKKNVENPKTGVESLTLLLISSLTLIVIIAYYKNNFSLFKKI